MTAAEVIRAAMELPPAEREEVAQTLLESIGGSVDGAEIDAAWKSEISSRIDDIRSGKVTMLTREELDAYLDDQRAARSM